jgi:CspA family cold shock protein
MKEGMKEGKVKWFDLEKGFGFISAFGQEEDVFLHITDLKASGYESVEKGELIEFEEKLGKNGKTRAKNITIFEYVYE